MSTQEVTDPMLRGVGDERSKGDEHSDKQNTTSRSNPQQKAKVLSVRLTAAQADRLDEMIRRIEKATGTRVTKSSLILRLIEFGAPQLRNVYPGAFSSFDLRFNENSQSQNRERGDGGHEEPKELINEVDVEILPPKKRFIFF